MSANKSVSFFNLRPIGIWNQEISPKIAEEKKSAKLQKMAKNAKGNENPDNVRVFFWSVHTRTFKY